MVFESRHPVNMSRENRSAACRPRREPVCRTLVSHDRVFVCIPGSVREQAFSERRVLWTGHDQIIAVENNRLSGIAGSRQAGAEKVIRG